MTTAQRSRVPAGVPAGGRFAPTSRPESGIHLDDTDPAAPPPAIPRQRPGGGIATLKAEIAARRGELDSARDIADRAELLADIADRQDRLIALMESGTDSSPGDEIAGPFGSVSVMPRAAESGPGTLVIVDTSGQSDGLPVVVMINDEVIHVPVEKPDEPADDELREVDSALQRHLAAIRSSDAEAEGGVQRLSARGAALAAVRADPDCRYLDLDWGEDGLVAIASRDVFVDAGPAPDGPIDLYTTNLRPSHQACRDFLTEQPDGTYRLDVDAALGRPGF